MASPAIGRLSGHVQFGDMALNTKIFRSGQKLVSESVSPLSGIHGQQTDPSNRAGLHGD